MKRTVLAHVLLLIFFVHYCRAQPYPHAGGGAQEAPPGSVLAQHRMAFHNRAHGGVLWLMYTPYGRFSQGISVETAAGAAPEEIASLLAAQAQGSSAIPLRFENGALVLVGGGGHGNYILAGSETGLGIPAPPVFLSAGRGSDDDSLHLFWLNPPGGYDSIAIVTRGTPEKQLPGDSESYELRGVNAMLAAGRGQAVICVLGYKQGIPSNGGVIQAREGSQNEYPEVPFTANTMPNWRKWGHDGEKSAVTLFEGTELVPRRAPVERASSSPSGNVAYYQGVKIAGSGARGGIYRKFLGLIPGRRYRVAARVNTWQMDSATQEWSYSFHACPGYSDGRDYTPEQFAGLEPLPDGSEGPEAACVVSYGPGKTTRGKWVEVSTSDGGLPGKTVGDIVLPDGVTEIVLWVRHTGTNTSGVGLDWSSLVDLPVTSVSAPRLRPR
jgi:hypothetical protein